MGIHDKREEKMSGSVDAPLSRTRGLFALGLWYSVNISTVILNKWLFKELNFHFPLLLTLCHMTMCYVLASIVLVGLRAWPLTPVSSAQRMNRIAPLACIFVINIVLGNVSLDYVPVSFMQTVKSSVPAFTYVLQTALGYRPFESDTAASLVPVVFGVMLATWTEVNFNWIGFLCAIVASVTTAIQSIVSGFLLGGALKMDPVNLVYNLSPIAAVLLLPAFYMFEYSTLMREWDQVVTGNLIWLLIVSSIVAFTLNFSVFFAIKNTSTLTFTVAGNLKVVFVILISVAIFRNEVTATNGLGIIITILGCWWNNSVQYQKKQNQTSQNK